MGLELSDRQQRTVAAALTTLAAVAILVVIGGVFWLIGLFVSRFSTVFLPLAVAGIAALVIRPYFEWLQNRLRLPIPVALVAVFVSVLVPVGGFVWFFGALLVDQVSDLVDRAPEAWSRVEALVREHAPQVVAWVREHGVLERVQETAQREQDALVRGLQSLGSQAVSAGKSVMRGIGLTFNWAVVPVYFAFFLLARPGSLGKVENILPFLKPETRDDVVYLFNEFVGIVVAFFRGQLVIALLQGLLFAAGFSLVGLRYGFLIGLTLGFLNIVPYLGSIIGLATALPIATFQQGGGILLVIEVLLVFAVVQLIEGYLLTPRIMGDRTGLHPMVIIVAIFFWGSALGGILGMILAIPLTAFLVVFWRLAREKYITGVV